MAVVLTTGQRLMPVLTNLVALPSIWYTWRAQLYGISAVSAIGMSISIFYHVCASWPSACLGAGVVEARANDYIWAPFVVAVMAVHVLNLYVFPWASVINYVLLAAIIMAQILLPFSMHAFRVIILATGALLVIRVTILGALAELMGSEPRKSFMFDEPGRFSWPYLLIGLVLSLVAFAGFVVDDPAVEWFVHSFMWHVPVFAAQFFIALGTTRNSPAFPDFLRRFDGGDPHPISPSDAPVFYGASTTLPVAAPMGSGGAYSNTNNLFGERLWGTK